MAIYHLSAKIVSRSTGRSAVAAAAYRSASRLRDERTGQDHDFTRKSGVVHREIVAPDNAPEWMLDRSQLWNAVERVEKRRDAQLAREIEVGLPRELVAERHVPVVRDFVEAEFVSAGMVADFAIHHGRALDGGDQPHAHIMLTTRELLGEGFGAKNRDWNAPDRLEGWRSRWAEHLNRELEREGHEARVDHRSLEAQRIEAEREAERARTTGDMRSAETHDARAASLDREPEPKLGPTASQMEKAGVPSRRADERRAVEARNAERRALREQARELAREIAEVSRQVVEAARRRLHDLGQRLETAYRAVRERAGTMTKSPPAHQRASEGTGAASPLKSAARDALLGRARSPIADAARDIARDVLLGRSPPNNARDTDAPDIDALLGRSAPERGGAKRDRDDPDHSR